MENLFDFDGGSVACRVFPASTDLKDKLIASLTSFLRLYSQHRDGLQRASESFTLTAARLQDVPENSMLARALCVVFGGGLSAVYGGVTGGIGGALAAVSAATCARICGHINAVGATLGFVGSMLGGVVGGAFCGAVGGAVCAEVKATASPVHGTVSDVLWFTIGCATGGAIGGIFGGTVGAAGGATGGAFGALCATRFAVGLVEVIDSYCRGNDSTAAEANSVKMKVAQRGGDFSGTIKLLVDELKTIKAVSDKMAASGAVLVVAEQTAKTVASVTAMEKTISDSRSITDLPLLVSSVDEAARQSKKITEELEETKTEVEKLLVSLKKH